MPGFTAHVPEPSEPPAGALFRFELRFLSTEREVKDCSYFQRDLEHILGGKQLRSLFLPDLDLNPDRNRVVRFNQGDLIGLHYIIRARK